MAEGGIKKVTMGQYALSTISDPDYCINLMLALKIKGDLDIDRLKNVVSEIVRKNDAFSHRFFREESGDIVYKIVEKEKDPLHIFEAKGDTDEARFNDAAGIIKDFLHKGEEECYKWGRPYDFILVKTGDDEYILYVRVVHLMSDGVSIGILMKKIVAEYNGEEMDESLSFTKFLDELPKYYESDEYKKIWEDNKELLDEYENFKSVLSLPETGRHKTNNAFVTVLDLTKVKDFCDKNKLTYFHMILFFFHLAVAVIMKKREALILVPIGNRCEEYKNTIGYLIDCAYSKLTVSDEKTIHGMALECRDQFLKSFQTAPTFFDMYCNKHSSLDFIMSYLNHVGDINTKIPFGDAEATMVADPAITGEDIIINCGFLSAMETGTNLVCSMYSDENIFTPEEVIMIGDLFQTALDCLAGEDETFDEFEYKFMQKYVSCEEEELTI